MSRIPLYSFLLILLFTTSGNVIAQDNKTIDNQVVKEVDENLKVFLAALQVDIENHYWESILSKASPGHYETQVLDLGIKKYQYIAELLGLNHVQNNIRLADTAISKEHLNQIEKVTFEPIQKEEGTWLHVTGKIWLSDERVLNVNITIHHEKGRYLLSGAVG